MKESEENQFVSATELLEKLFAEVLVSEEFDSEIVALTQEHLGVASPHSKAGNNLALALLELAERRAGDKK